MQKKYEKNIIKVAFVAVFALMAGYGVYTSQQEKISELALANVEAMASRESTSDTGPGKRMIVLVWVLAMEECV